jgi:N-sulfoglucosamine sulfohydrolase
MSDKEFEMRSRLACLLSLFALSSAKAEEKPNVILLLTDDQSYHLSLIGTPGLKTPNIDALAKRGVFFTKAYAASASCAPCRAAILTGMYPHSNGAWRNTAGPENLNAPDDEFGRKASKTDSVGVHEDIPTLIEMLNANGYFTGITEKWHLSPPWKFPFNFRDQANLTPDGSAKAVKKFIQTADGKPFFLQANVDNTHRPYQLHIGLNKNLSRVNPADVVIPPCWPDTPKTRQDYAEYLTTVQHADAVIGAIIQIIKDAGLLESTIFIYSSDQGFCYTRAKATTYDWGVHIPLAIAGPGIKADITSAALVSHTDIMPTVLDYAGIDIPKTVQGKSLRPILDGSAADVVRAYVCSEHNAHGGAASEYYPTRSITDGKFRYNWNLRYQTVPNQSIDSFATDPNARKAIRAPAWMPWDALSSDVWQNNAYEEIIFHKDEFPEQYALLKATFFRPEVELYDLENDPYEIKNLAENPEYKPVLNKMRRALSDWMEESGDKGDPRSIKRNAE